MSDEEIIELQSRIAFQEYQISELSSQIALQQKQILELKGLCETIVERLKSGLPAVAENSADGIERPPHY